MVEDFPQTNSATEHSLGQDLPFPEVGAAPIGIHPESAPDQASSSSVRTPPPGFKYNPGIMATYDEQIRLAIERQEYQDAPPPSFEHTPRADIMPIFNPTGAPEEEIYARNRRPKRLGRGRGLHSEFGYIEPVDIWRIVDRARLADGTGLASSQILLHNTLGDIEHFDEWNHLSTEHDSRMQTGNETPFISFTTDPTGLARIYILEMGFGIKNSRDSVVVRARVDPTRLITTGQKKEEAAALVGGVAPNEYIEAFEVSDFVRATIPQHATFYIIKGDSEPLTRDDALQYWQNL